MPTIPAEAAAYMSRHHGVITRSRAASFGIDSATVQRLRESGALITLHRGVYAAAASATTPERTLLAAIAAGGQGSRASHRSAAWLRGIIDEPPPMPTITVDYRRGGRLEGVEVHRSRALGPASDVRGIPTTTLVVTLRDLTVQAGAAELTWLVDRAFGNRLVRPADLMRELGGDRHHPGARRLLAHLAERGFGDRDDAPPSVAESHLHRLVAAAGLPQPDREVTVWAEGHEYSLDTAYRALMLCFEADGHASHSSPEQISRDHDRRAALRGVGWDVVVFTYGDLTRQRARVIRRLRSTYLAHGGELSGEMSRDMSAAIAAAG